MVIPPFDINSLFDALPCPMCHDRGAVFMTCTGTASSKSDKAFQEELVRYKLYGEYE